MPAAKSPTVTPANLKNPQTKAVTRSPRVSAVSRSRSRSVEQPGLVRLGDDPVHHRRAVAVGRRRQPCAVVAELVSLSLGLVRRHDDGVRATAESKLVTTASRTGGRRQGHTSYTPTPEGAKQEESFVRSDCHESQRPRYYKSDMSDCRRRSLLPRPSLYSMT